MRIVQKYGGTSVADIARLESVALKIKRDVDAGHEIVVVVSAMAGVTNKLVEYTKAFSNVQPGSEHDVVFSTGEQVTTGLLSLALQQLGLRSRSFMGWQLPIQTTIDHTNAQILSVDPEKLEACLRKGIVPIIAGFQGVTVSQRLTTLGRGGSDTTAVAVAAAIRADRCDIYTDVDGIYTADPRIVNVARKLDQISYLEMLELAAQGAKVLHSRSVETALKHGVHLRVLSSFNEGPGTEIIGETPSDITRISGITHSAGWVVLHLDLDLFTPQVFYSLRQSISEAGIGIDSFLVQETFPGARISFLVQKPDFAKAIQTLEKGSDHSLYKSLHIEPNFARISIIGLNLFGKNGKTEHFLELIKQIGTSSCLTWFSHNRLSVGVREEAVADVIQTFHKSFGLDQKDGSDIKEIMATGL